MKKLSKKTTIILTIASAVLMLFGFFYIPILSACGVQFPARNLLWGLSILPTVVICSIPFCFFIGKILHDNCGHSSKCEDEYCKNIHHVDGEHTESEENSHNEKQKNKESKDNEKQKAAK